MARSEANPALTLAGPLALHLVAASSVEQYGLVREALGRCPEREREHRLRGPAAGFAPGARAGEHREEPLETLRRRSRSRRAGSTTTRSRSRRRLQFAPGHRLQLRLTSDNLPNATPGTLTLNEADPAASGSRRSAGINTVRFGGDGTSLLLPVYGSGSAGSRTTHRRAAGPVAQASVRRVRGSKTASASAPSGRPGAGAGSSPTAGPRPPPPLSAPDFTHVFAYRRGRAYRVRLIVIAASGRRASTMVAVWPRPPKLTPAPRRRR